MYWIYCVFLLSFTSLCERGRFKNVIYKLSLIILIIFTTGNYFNGIDWINYQKHYQMLYESGFSSDYLAYEPGFMFLMFLFSNVLSISNFHSVVIFCSLFSLISITFFIKKIPYEFNKSLFLLLFTLLSYPLFNDALRQLLAVSIILPFLADLKSHSIKKLFFVCLISCLFHASSILIFPILIAARNGLTQKRMLCYFLCSLFCFAFLLSLQIIIPAISIIIPNFVYSKIISYLSKTPDFKFGFFVLVDFLGIGLTIFLNKKVKNSQRLLSYNACVFLYFLLHFTFYSAPFLQRLLLYIFPIVPVFAAIVFSHSKRFSFSLLMLPLIGTMCILSFIRNVTNPYYTSDFNDPKFFYTEIFGGVKNISDIKYDKCFVISQFDPTFCPK